MKGRFSRCGPGRVEGINKEAEPCGWVHPKPPQVGGQGDEVVLPEPKEDGAPGEDAMGRGCGCSGGGPGAQRGGAGGGPPSVLRPPPAPRGCWPLGTGLQEARASSSLAWRRAEGPGEWVEGAGWLCGEQWHSHEGKGLWGQRGTQERRRQICRRAFLPWVPGECKLQGSNYTKSRNPLLDP